CKRKRLTMLFERSFYTIGFQCSIKSNQVTLDLHNKHNLLCIHINTFERVIFNTLNGNADHLPRYRHVRVLFQYTMVDPIFESNPSSILQEPPLHPPLFRHQYSQLKLTTRSKSIRSFSIV